MDTGDSLVGGGVLGDRTLGEAVVEGMNLMGYDAMAIGANELSLGPELLGKRMQAARFPFLSANAVLAADGSLFAEPYAIFDIDGTQIGIVGITAKPTHDLPGFRVLDPAGALAKVVPDLRVKVDTVIVITNLSYRAGKVAALGVPGVDLLITGSPEQLPTQTVRLEGTGALVVAAEQPVLKHTGRRVGVLLLELQADGTLRDLSWQSRAMTPDIPDDPAMADLLDRFQNEP